MDISNILNWEERREQERSRLLDGDVISEEWVYDGFFTEEELAQNYERNFFGWVKVRSPTYMENARMIIAEGAKKAERLKAEIARLQESYDKTMALISDSEQRLKS